MEPGTPRLYARLLLATGSIAIALLLVEAALRILGLVAPSAFYQLDTTTGHAHRPGARGWFLQEGAAFIAINEDGLRGPSVPRRKAKGTLRIAVLGDSYAEGFQVPIEQTLSSVVQAELRASCAPQAEVIGFGVSDYGTAQELLALRDRVWPYSPDIVVLAFHTGNDIRNNSKSLDPNPNRPYFELVDGSLVLDDSFRDWQKSRHWFHSAVSRSLLLQHLDRLRATLMAPKPALETIGAECGVDERIYRPPATQTWEQAWAITEALLLATRGEVRSREADLLVLTLSNGIQVHPDPAVRGAFAERARVDDLFYAERRIFDFGASNDIGVLNLAPELQQQAEARGEFLHGFDEAAPGVGHWNERGHALAAKLVARRLCAEYIEPRGR